MCNIFHFFSSVMHALSHDSPHQSQLQEMKILVSQLIGRGRNAEYLPASFCIKRRLQTNDQDNSLHSFNGRHYFLFTSEGGQITWRGESRRRGWEGETIRLLILSVSFRIINQNISVRYLTNIWCGATIMQWFWSCLVEHSYSDYCTTRQLELWTGAHTISADFSATNNY